MPLSVSGNFHSPSTSFSWVFSFADMLLLGGRDALPSSSSILIAFLLGLPFFTTAAPTPPAVLTPARPKYDLQCLPYPSDFPNPADNPWSCQSLIFVGIPALTPDPSLPIRFTNDPAEAASPTRLVPFTISSQGMTASSSVKFNASTALPISSLPDDVYNTTGGLTPLTSRSTSGENKVDVCTIRFFFKDGTSAQKHSERWGLELLKRDAVIAWGKCMLRPDQTGPRGPPQRAVMIPKPGSKTLNLGFEIRVQQVQG